MKEKKQKQTCTFRLNSTQCPIASVEFRRKRQNFDWLLMRPTETGKVKCIKVSGLYSKRKINNNNHTVPFNTVLTGVIQSVCQFMARQWSLLCFAACLTKQRSKLFCPKMLIYEITFDLCIQTSLNLCKSAFAEMHRNQTDEPNAPKQPDRDV